LTSEEKKATPEHLKIDKREFNTWHEERMQECGYPEYLQAELRADRTKWLGGVKE